MSDPTAFNLQVETLSESLVRVTDAGFPGLEGFGTEWRLAASDLADKIEQSRDDRDSLNYAEFLREFSNHPRVP